MRKKILKLILIKNYIFLKLGRIKTQGFVGIESGVDIQLGLGAKVSFGKNIYIRRGAVIDVAAGATLSIGDDVFIAHGVTLAAHKKMTIGADTMIAEYVSVRDHDHRFDQNKRLVLQGEKQLPVTIADNVWIGAKATVTKGVSIGSHSVIGANAVVTKNVPVRVVAVGAPAKVIREIK